AAATIGDGQPDLYASSQTLLACLLKKAGHNVAARQHFERGERFYVALQHAIGLAAANETSDTITTGDATSDDAAEGTSFINPHQVVDTLASTAAILSYHDRLPLVASELLDLVHKTGQFAATGAVIRRKDGSVRTFGVVPKTETTRTLHSVTAQGTLELHVDGDSSAEAVSIVQSLTAVMKALSALEQARFDRSARATLWTELDAPTNEDGSVVSGHMRDVMNLARKVAKTNVTVLVIGESGTGKEVVARAIHDASNNSHKPFVPFNCTAV